MKHFQLFKTIRSSEKYFLFTDGSTRRIVTPAVIGLGAELRNHQGDLIFTYAEDIAITELPTHISPDASEKIALIRSLTVCLQENVKLLIVHTDSSGLSCKINSFLEAKHLKNDDYTSMLNTVKLLDQQIFNLVDKFDEFFIEHIPRELNRYADFYSRSASLLIKNHAFEHFKNCGDVHIKKYDVNQAKSIKTVYSKLISKPDISHKEIKQNTLYPSNFLMKKATSKPLPSSKVSAFITPSSLSIADIMQFNKHYFNRDEGILLNIDVQDSINNISVRFFYGDHQEKNHKAFQTLRIKKDGFEGYALLYVLFNLMTQSSSVDLKKSFSELDKHYAFEYSHSLWKTFTLDHKSYLKTRSYISKTVLSSLKRILSSSDPLRHDLGIYLDDFIKLVFNNPTQMVLHHTYNHQQLYLDDYSIAAANAASILLNGKKALELKAKLNV